jgi:ferrochelatase
MRIEVIKNIIDAQLLNQGFISEVTGFCDKAEDVKRGFLFLCDDEEEIKKAVQNGAYVILSTKNTEIIDKEIAWMRVDCFEDAILKLLKYKLLNQKLYFCDKIVAQVLKSLTKEITVIDKIDISYLNKEGVFVTFLDKIKNIAFEVLEINQIANIKVLSHTVFMCKIFYKKERYDIVFPFLYLKELQKALGFLEYMKIEVELKNINFNRLKCVFVNKNCEEVEFGKSEKVIIRLYCDEFFVKELNYLINEIKHGVIKFFDKTNINRLCKEQFNFGIVIDEQITLKKTNCSKEKTLLKG